MNVSYEKILHFNKISKKKSFQPFVIFQVWPLNVNEGKIFSGLLPWFVKQVMYQWLKFNWKFFQTIHCELFMMETKGLTTDSFNLQFAFLVFIYIFLISFFKIEKSMKHCHCLSLYFEITFLWLHVSLLNILYDFILFWKVYKLFYNRT